MPRSTKYTKEVISVAAYELVRREGASSLTARRLAAELGCSTAPLFTAFPSIDAVRDEVIKRSYSLYSDYLKKAMQEPLPFKAAGLNYIRFAKDEPKLFALLFMGKGDGGVTHYFPSGDVKNEPRVRGTVESFYGMSEESSKRLYNHMSVYAHGLAVLAAEGNSTFTDEDVSRMLSEAFSAFKEVIK